jgi:hypothetical protein
MIQHLATLLSPGSSGTVTHRNNMAMAMAMVVSEHLRLGPPKVGTSRAGPARARPSKLEPPTPGPPKVGTSKAGPAQAFAAPSWNFKGWTCKG